MDVSRTGADAVVVDARTCGRAWLQAADVVVGQHRTRRRARRWVVSVRARFPGCAVAVAWSRHGRWLVLAWPGGVVVVTGEVFDAAVAAEFGLLVYEAWTRGGGGVS